MRYDLCHPILPSHNHKYNHLFTCLTLGIRQGLEQMKGTCSGPHQTKQGPALLFTKVTKATKALYFTFSLQRRVSVCPDCGNQNPTVTDRGKLRPCRAVTGGSFEALQSHRAPADVSRALKARADLTQPVGGERTARPLWAWSLGL